MSVIELEATVVAEGLVFGEGPRWHDDALWFSDMHDGAIKRLLPDGSVERVLEFDGQPSGLGWLPDGRLLAVSMLDRRVLRLEASGFVEHADLSGLAAFHCNDMVVAADGRAWVGNFGFDLHAGEAPRGANLMRVDPDGSVSLAADELLFPNGTVITPDGATLILGESFGGRLTAFDIAADGRLENRRVWAQLPEGAVPDGIALDAGGGIWVASPTSNECLRIEEGGTVTHRVGLDRGAFACMLGGDDGRILFVLTAEDSDPEVCRRLRSARIETTHAPFPRDGWP